MKFNVVTFLSELFAPTKAIRPDSLSEHWRVWFEERAGIMEYHGNLPREVAETEAMAETVRLMSAEGTQEKTKKTLPLVYASVYT
jgi:hypothetical protein